MVRTYTISVTQVKMIETYPTVVRYFPQLDSKETETAFETKNVPNSSKVTDKVQKKRKSSTKKGQKPKYKRTKSSFKDT